MAKVTYKAFNRQGKEVGRFQFFGPSLKKAENSARRLIRQKKNIFAGFHDDDGVFHPIRASADYVPSRAGEKGRRRPAKRRKKSRRR